MTKKKAKAPLLAVLAMGASALLGALALLCGCGAPSDTAVQTGGAPLKSAPMSPQVAEALKQAHKKKFGN